MRTCDDYCDQLGGPWRPGWGLVFHAGEPDDRMRLLPGPLVIVSLNHDRDNANWLDHPRVVANLTVGIHDNEKGVLADDLLVALVEAGKGFLARGINLLVHCAAGKSRSGYYTCALFMRVRGCDFDTALAQVRTWREKVEPNEYFAAHLRRLEARLRR